MADCKEVLLLLDICIYSLQNLLIDFNSDSLPTANYYFIGPYFDV